MLILSVHISSSFQPMAFNAIKMALIPCADSSAVWTVCCVQCGFALVSLRFSLGPSAFAPNHLDFPCLNFDIHRTFVLAGWSHSAKCNTQWKTHNRRIAEKLQMKPSSGQSFLVVGFFCKPWNFFILLLPLQNITKYNLQSRACSQRFYLLQITPVHIRLAAILWYAEPPSTPFPLASAMLKLINVVSAETARPLDTDYAVRNTVLE